jgi:hypothetical protein
MPDTQKIQSPADELKKPYSEPELVRYGDLDELTQTTAVKAPTADVNSIP